MPPQTRTNANKVPMLVSEITNSRFKNNAGIATTNPVNIVEKEGVLKRGCMVEKIFGNRPSRLIASQIRGWPN